MTKESITIVLPLPNRVLQPNCTIGSFGGRMMKANATKKYKRLTYEAIENEGTIVQIIDERLQIAIWLYEDDLTSKDKQLFNLH